MVSRRDFYKKHAGRYLPFKLKMKNLISMKLAKIYAAALLVAISAAGYAQTSSTTQKKTSTAAGTSKSQAQAGQISDDDLKKYAETLDSVKVMQTTLNQIIAENVQKNTVMTVDRYNQLFKIEKDEAKLTAANVTAEEKAFLQEIADLREYNVDRINKTYQALAKDYVGLKTFNLIRKSLESDADLKSRYESISQEVQTSKASATSQGE
jgi:hypothetical protein